MTHTLDMGRQSSQLVGSQPLAASMPSRTASASKFGTFAITFGIAFAILYTVCERWNWPIFTYHPAIGSWDLWRGPNAVEDGPPMFWYGWLVPAAAGALLLGWIATKISAQSLQRATIFCCVLALLWTADFALANVIADQTGFGADFLPPVWTAAIPALLVAAAVGCFLPARWVQRVWPAWLLIMPIGGLIVLGYSLNQYFLH